MLDTRKFAVEDISRMFRIPPGMLGSQQPGASSYASSETWKDQFRELTLAPFVARIEGQHSRLVRVPDRINDPNASAQFRFNLDAYLRADALKRMQAYREGIQAGYIHQTSLGARKTSRRWMAVTSSTCRRR